MSRDPVIVAGAGPAGLFAAETVASAGQPVILVDSRRSPGRKFLIAGRHGLNLTNTEPMDSFRRRYTGPPDFWSRALGEFDSKALRQWSAALGYPTFESSGGKVFPESMKASGPLRAWLKRLQSIGVEFRLGEGLLDIGPSQVTLKYGDQLPYSALVLAMGGASWPRTGSTGEWTAAFSKRNIEIHQWEPANCGWEVDWPDSFLAVAEGRPLKNVRVSSATQACDGELVVTKYGLEGGPIYRLGPELRTLREPLITLDLKPSIDSDEVIRRLGTVKKNYVREADRRLRIGEVGRALLKSLPGIGPWRDGASLARVIKKCPIQLKGPRPIEEAISSAGGLAWKELNDVLMIRKMPGVFAAGEMIDWEAPTGGYLLQGCFATGRIAGKGALQWVEESGD